MHEVLWCCLLKHSPRKSSSYCHCSIRWPYAIFIGNPGTWYRNSCLSNQHRGNISGDSVKQEIISRNDHCVVELAWAWSSFCINKWDGIDIQEYVLKLFRVIILADCVIMISLPWSIGLVYQSEMPLLCNCYNVCTQVYTCIYPWPCHTPLQTDYNCYCTIILYMVWLIP